MSPGARRALTGLAGAAAVIAGVTVVSRVLGFGRWFVQSYAVGATATGTAYATANQLPNVLFEVVAGGALAGAVVPLLAAPLARGLRHDVDRIASGLLTWAVAVLLPASIALALLARPVVALLVTDEQPGADGAALDPGAVAATVDLGARLLVMFAPQVVLYGIGVVLTGVLQAQRRFTWPAAAPIASTLVVVVSYLLFRATSHGHVQDPAGLPGPAVAWLGWGTTAGVAAMTLPLIVPVVRSGVRLRPTLRFPEGVATRARRLALAGIGGLLAQQMAVLVTVRLANTHGTAGTINLFFYSQAVYFLPYAVLAVPLATAAFPRLAEHAATGDRGVYRRLVSVSTRAVLLVAVAGAAALVAAAPAVAALFAQVDRSKAPDAVAAMAPTLTALAPGLLGYALIFHLSRVLFARERGRAAVSAVAGGWLAVAVASVVAVDVMAPGRGDNHGTLVGLAVGSTIGMAVAGVALLAAVARTDGRQAVAGLGRTTTVALAGALPGAALGRVVVDRLVVDGAGWALVVLAGVAAALLAAGGVGAAGWAGDRGTLRGVRHPEQGASEPAPAPAPAGPARTPAPAPPGPARTGDGTPPGPPGPRAGTAADPSAARGPEAAGEDGRQGNGDA